MTEAGAQGSMAFDTGDPEAPGAKRAPNEMTAPTETAAETAPTQKRKIDETSPPPEPEPAKRPRADSSGDGEDGGDGTRSSRAPPALLPRLETTAKADGGGAHRETPTPTKNLSPAVDRRAGVTQEERRRGQRLFGGLLSTLSQTVSRAGGRDDGAQLKRRREAEQRQQDRLRKQKIEHDKVRAEKAALLRTSRSIRQVGLDEEIMKERHANKLSAAHFLRTKAEPHLYYLPYDPTEEQEAVIEQQVRAVSEDIAREVAAFRQEKRARLAALGVEVEDEEEAQVSTSEAAASEPKADKTSHPPTAGHQRPEAEPVEPAPAEAQDTASHEKEHPDEAGDVMVEAEDTVIY